MSEITKALQADQLPPSFQEMLRQEAVMAAAQLESTDRVLEVGCGIGRSIQNLAPLVKEYTGIDVDAEVLEQARAVAAAHPSAQVLEMDVQSVQLNYPVATFDVVASHFNTVGSLERPDVALLRMSQVCRRSLLISLQAKGALDLRRDYYEQLQIPFEIDPKTEGITSATWGLSRAYEPQEIEELAINNGCSVQSIVPLGRLAHFAHLQPSPAMQGFQAAKILMSQISAILEPLLLTDVDFYDDLYSAIFSTNLGERSALENYGAYHAFIGSSFPRNRPEMEGDTDDRRILKHLESKLARLRQLRLDNS